MKMDLERLARLVDERPAPEERAALDADPRLRRELEALRAQTDALGAMPALRPPPEGWRALERKLQAAGLIDPAAASVVWRKWLQAAAALALFVGGTAFGWVTGSAPPSASSPAASAAVDEAEGASFASIEEARAAVQRAEERWMRAYSDYRRVVDAQGPGQRPLDPAKRLAGIEALLAASQVVVSEAPTDPFFNGFLVNAVLEREQTLREIGLDNWH